MLITCEKPAADGNLQRVLSWFAHMPNVDGTEIKKLPKLAKIRRYSVQNVVQRTYKERIYKKTTELARQKYRDEVIKRGDKRWFEFYAHGLRKTVKHIKMHEPDTYKKIERQAEVWSSVGPQLSAMQQ